MSSEKIVEIAPFDTKYLDYFAQYTIMIHDVLPFVGVELVGSAAVPMIGKREIDVLVICDDIHTAHDKLHSLGLSKGAFVQGPFHNEVGYLKDYRFGVEAEFHLHYSKDEQVSHIRNFIGLLKRDSVIRDGYASLKMRLNGLPRAEYRAGKAEFMKKISHLI